MKFIPFKRFVQSRKGGAWGQDAGKDEVDVSCVRVADFEYDKLTSKKILSTIRSIPARQYKNIKLNKGDILIEKSGGGETTLVGRAISFDQEIDTICSNFIERIEIKTNKLEPKFACYILASAYSNKINASCIKQTTGIQNLDVDAYLSSVLVPDIPKEKQRRIVDFLESKIKDISDSIFKKRVCLQKFSEYRQSLITQAVTKGLDPNAEMKDSGVEWIGKIPAHWKVARVGVLFKLSNGLSTGGEKFGSGYPFVSYGDVYRNLVLPELGSGLVLSTEEERVSYSVRRGDVFFTRTSETVEEIGIASTCLKTIENATFAGFLIKARPTEKVLVPEFSGFYFRSNCHRPFFIRKMNLVTRASLSQSLLSKLPVLIPPLEEQKQIYDHLSKINSKVDNLTSMISSSIEKLQEYRSSLITAAVTGKIDINEVK